MEADYGKIIRDICAEASAPADYTSLDAEELAELCLLQVDIFFAALTNEYLPIHKPTLKRLLKNLCEETIRRAARATDICNSVLLSRALHALKRSGIDVSDTIRNIDERVVRHVVAEKPADWRLHHAALTMLMQEPLTGLRFVAHGKRERVFSIGRNYFENTLRHWADTIDVHGRWKEVGAEEAWSRIMLFERDFGSVKGVDNLTVTERAYQYYRNAPCRNPSELRAKYCACTWRWASEPSDFELTRFATEARGMLRRNMVFPAEKWRLCSVLFRAAEPLTCMDAGTETVA